KRATPATPMVAAPSQVAHARCVQGQIRYARDLAGVERLGARVEIHSAAFEEHDLEPRLGQSERQRNPRRSTADDRYVWLQDRARRNSPGINERVQIGNIRKLLAARYRDGRSVSCRNCRDTQIETVDVEAVARRTC